MTRFHRQLLAAIAAMGSIGWAGWVCFMILPPATYAQTTPPARLRGVHSAQPPAPANSQPTTPGPQTPSTPTAPQAPLSLLEQPAAPARIAFAGDSLAIHADNSSLTSILHEVAAKNGMRIEGLKEDERVFGTFGPGPPRDVLADLLNGTNYNVVLLGDLATGGELILTPTTRPAVAPATPGQVNSQPEEVSNDQESPDPAPQPDAQPPAPQPTPPNPGVRTPQQLFEQLQRMRQAQQTAQPPPQ